MLLLLCLTLFVAESWQIRTPIDDAFISFRYARNLVEGQGLVFNPGEYIEGYTNLLWTLLVAAGMALGVSAPMVAHVLGLVSGVAALAAGYVYAGTGLATERRWIAAIAPLLIMTTIGFSYWSMSGLETALFLACVTIALASHARDRMGVATLAACAATMTRPDGGLVAVVIFAFHLAAHWREGWRAWRWPVAYGGFLVALTVFRLLYYGDPLPNTFYAKVGGVPLLYGRIYIQFFLMDGALWLLLPAAFSLLADRRLLPGLVYALLVTAYVFRVGGDAFPYYRFLLPVLVCLAVLAVRGIDAAYRRNPTLGIALATGVPLSLCWNVFGGVPPLLLAAILAFAGSWSLGILVQRPDWTVKMAIGVAAVLCLTGIFGILTGSQSILGPLRESRRSQALAQQERNNEYSEAHALRRSRAFLAEEPPPRLIATSSIGALGFHSRLRLLDIVGIIDPVIAHSEPDEVEGVFLIAGHQRSNVDYVLSRAPDYIVTPKPWTGFYIAAFAAIWNHPQVARDYTWIDDLSAYRRNPSPHPR